MWAQLYHGPGAFPLQAETQLIEEETPMGTTFDEVVSAPSAAPTPLSSLATPSPTALPPPDFTPEKVPQGMRIIIALISL